MTFEYATYGFTPPPDLVDFARVTALFEIWRPRRPLSRLMVSIDRMDGFGARFRCRVGAERGERSARAEAFADDAFEAVRDAAMAIDDPGDVPDGATALPPWFRSGGSQDSGSPSVTQPCEAS